MSFDISNYRIIWKGVWYINYRYFAPAQNSVLNQNCVNKKSLKSGNDIIFI